jgi:predicted esterase
MKHALGIIVFLFSITLNAQGKVTYTYAIKGSDTLKLDMYTPLNLKTTDTLPVLLWMHGGGFEGGSRDEEAVQNLCLYAANQGYVGVSISYRLLRKDSETSFGCDFDNDGKLNIFREAVTDYLDAANYLVQNSKSFQIDTTKIIAGGSSAGAEAIINAAYMREYFIDDLQKYKSVKFAGIFALAGALVNASYITKENALPSVLFHGTEDDFVPFATGPHRYCTTSNSGYIILDGSSTIAEKLSVLESAYYFYIVKGGMHELAEIPFAQLDDIFAFFDKTVFNHEIIQTKIIKQKQP